MTSERPNGPQMALARAILSSRAADKDPTLISVAERLLSPRSQTPPTSGTGEDPETPPSSGSTKPDRDPPQR